MAKTRPKMRVGTLQIVLERDGPYCRYCEAPAEAVGWRVDINGRLRVFVPGLQMDHVIPFAHGGSNDPDNLVMACDYCNLHRGTKPPLPMFGRKAFRLGPAQHGVIRDDYADRRRTA